MQADWDLPSDKTPIHIEFQDVSPVPAKIFAQNDGLRPSNDQLLSPLVFRARDVSAGDPPGAHAATLVQAEWDLPSEKTPIHIEFQDVSPVPAKIFPKNDGLRPSDDRLLYARANSNLVPAKQPPSRQSEFKAGSMLVQSSISHLLSGVERDDSELLPTNYLARNGPATTSTDATLHAQANFSPSILLGENLSMMYRDSSARDNSQKCRRSSPIARVCFLVTCDEQGEGLS